METKPINELTEVTAPAATDVIPIVVDPAGTKITKKTTIAGLLGVALTAFRALTAAANKIPYFTSGSAAGLLTLDTDGALSGNSDTALASQKATKTYADTKTTLSAVKADADVADAVSKKHAAGSDNQDLSGLVSHSLATAENDVLVGAPTPFGSWVKKTLAEFKVILGLASNVPAATAENDFMVSTATTFAWVKKTLAEVKTILGLGTAAYTDSSAYDAAGTAAGKIAASISDGDTTHAPDGNSVFDALALKASSEHDHRWTQTTGTFTATPASTSTITMTTDLTATILVGMPLKYVIGGTTYYGIVSAITANLLTVAGAPLGGDVTALYYGDPTRVTQINIIIPGLYEDASNTDLIASDLGSKLIWNKVKAYLVRFRVYSVVHDSGGTHGQASVQINNTEVNTTAGGELIAADTTWYPTVVNIATAAYDVNPGEEIEVTCIKGTTGDASDLTVEMTFVIP